MPVKPKILIVEDEPGVSMMMTHLLTHAGCGAQTAWNAEKALGLAQAEKFDLITLDINIPGTSGFDIYLGLKNIPHLKNTPVIFVSGGASGEDQQRAFELGAVDFISKPFEATDFISRIISHTKIKNRPAPGCLSEGATRRNSARRLLFGTCGENCQPFAGLKLRPQLFQRFAFWK